MDKRNEKIGIPTIWSKPKSHVDDRYFCITPIQGFTNESIYKIQYSNLYSTTLSVLHSTEILVPAFGKFKDCDDLNLSFVSRADFVTDPDFLNNFEIRTNSSASTISSH